MSAFRRMAWGVALAAATATAVATVTAAAAAPRPEKQGPPSAIQARTAAPQYDAGVLGIRAPQDTVGQGNFRAAERLFETGLLDSAAAQFQRFAMAYPRNLSVNDALEYVLLVRHQRDEGGAALLEYVRARALRRAGFADSAAVAARAALETNPNARVRYHLTYLLAEIARDRGDHAAAIEAARAVADSTAKSRLAPYALELLASETLAAGRDPTEAVRYYQELLERYPDSPLAPSARARALEIRKRLQR